LLPPKAKTRNEERQTLKSKNSFTLVELLAIIAIIGLLAALLLPALKSAKDKAHSICCAGNLRQIGASIMMYTGDNRGEFPTGYNQAAVAAGLPSTEWYIKPPDCPYNSVGYWIYFIQPYLGYKQYVPNINSGVFHCPTFSKRASLACYGQESYYLCQVANADYPTYVWRRSVQSLKRPGSSGLYGDAQLHDYGYWHPDCSNGDGSSGLDDTSLNPRNGAVGEANRINWSYHNNGMNVMFGDFHVKWVSRPEMQAKRYFRIGWSLHF